LTKDDVGFELNSLELAGRLAMNDADSKDRHDSDADTLTNESSSSEFDDSDDDSSSSSSYTESSSASDESATGSSSSATSEDEDECSDDDTRVRDPGAGKTLISVLTEEVSCESSTVVDLTDAATGDKGTDSLHEQFVSLTVGNDSASPRTNEGGVQVPCNQESCESSNFVDLTDAATDDKDTDSLHEQFVSLTVGNDSASPRTNEGGVQVPCNPE
jgi:hypothetical protein